MTQWPFILGRLGAYGGNRKAQSIEGQGHAKALNFLMKTLPSMDP